MAALPNFATDGNPFDFYRHHIAGLLAECIHLKASNIVPAVQRSQKLDKGDCVLAVPALRIRGKTPHEVANTIKNEVRTRGRSVCAITDHAAVPGLASH